METFINAAIVIVRGLGAMGVTGGEFVAALSRAEREGRDFDADDVRRFGAGAEAALSVLDDAIAAAEARDAEPDPAPRDPDMPPGMP
jgi:hypothetical protein